MLTSVFYCLGFLQYFLVIAVLFLFLKVTGSFMHIPEHRESLHICIVTRLLLHHWCSEAYN